MSTTVGSQGRFCNHFLRNMALDCIARRNDLCAVYSYADEMQRLGIALFCGSRRYSTIRLCNESDMPEFLEGRAIPMENLDLRNVYCQTPEFAVALYTSLHTDPLCGAIRSANPYRDRYGANRSVFVHVRLGDARQMNPGYAYYAACLKTLAFTDGYLASDSPSNPLCTRLCREFGLRPYTGDEVDTLQFGSTCAMCVLSNGTFSWTIGALAFGATKVYYPAPRIQWHGDIFGMPTWTRVDL